MKDINQWGAQYLPLSLSLSSLETQCLTSSYMHAAWNETSLQSQKDGWCIASDAPPSISLQNQGEKTPRQCMRLKTKFLTCTSLSTCPRTSTCRTSRSSKCTGGKHFPTIFTHQSPMTAPKPQKNLFLSRISSQILTEMLHFLLMKSNLIYVEIKYIKGKL